MHDEFRATLARQGIAEEAYLKAVDKTEADLHAEFRPGAEKRVKTLLVLSKVADAEGVTVPDAEVEAEVARGRERYPDDAKLQALLRLASVAAPTSGARSGAAGSSKASSTTGWPTTPTIAPLPHLEDGPASADRRRTGRRQRGHRCDDPGSILDDVPTRGRLTRPTRAH